MLSCTECKLDLKAYRRGQEHQLAILGSAGAMAVNVTLQNCLGVTTFWWCHSAVDKDKSLTDGS